MKNRPLIIAIDGPAASGKSTTARLVAKSLGYLHVDTGAMYRAMTLKVLRHGINPDDQRGIAALAPNTTVSLKEESGSQNVYLDGEDVTTAIRSPEVTAAVSSVSRIKEVRAVMVREQQRIGQTGAVVLEGRDIGTVVFPDADLKIFMIAGIESRAKRRQKELEQTGTSTSIEHIVGELKARDELDSTRRESPLRRASDAVEIDTSNLSIEDQVKFIVTRAKEILEHSYSS